MSTRTPIITSDAIRTVAQGALGAMSFGAYHQYTTNRMMELNNAQIRAETQQNLKEKDEQIKSLQTQISQLQQQMNQRSTWGFW
jgi:prefoldin subunit 5